VKFGIGQSKDRDTVKAGEIATNQALSSLKEKPDFIILFASIFFDVEKLVSSVFTTSKKTPMIGCTTSGEILNDITFGSVIVVAVKCEEDEEIKPVFIEDIHNEPRKLAGELADLEKRDGFFMFFADGLFSHGSVLVRGINDYLSPKIKLIGSLAGDDLKRERTYQFYQGRVLTNGLSGAFFITKSKVKVGLRHGFYPISHPMRVTVSRENTIYEIDNHRASKVYLEFLGLSELDTAFGNVVDVKEVRHSPIGIPQITGDYKIREFIDIRDDGSIILDSFVPEGNIIRILGCSSQSLISSSNELVLDILSEIKPKIAFLFPSYSRMLILSDSAKDEIYEIKSIFGDNVSIVGFYGYGEIGSLRTRRSDFHNKSIGILAIE